MNSNESRFNWKLMKTNNSSEVESGYSVTLEELNEYAKIETLSINWAEYVDIHDLKKDKVSPALHYVKCWKHHNLILPDEFNTFEYLYLNKSLIEKIQNPLIHYFENPDKYLFDQIELTKQNVQEIEGLLENIKESSDKNEMVYVSTHELFEYKTLFKANIDWSQFEVDYNLSTDPILFYIKNWQSHDLKISDVFDGPFYLRKYSDVKSSGINPLMHYVTDGVVEGRMPMFQDNDEPVENEELIVEKFDLEFIHLKLDEAGLKGEYLAGQQLDIDWTDFFDFNNINEEKLDPLSYFLINWKKQSLVIPEQFDTEFYLETYPDIDNSGVNPMLHFFKHGINEGRVGILNVCIEEHIVKGKLSYDTNKPTLVIVCHESSATGAPLVGLNIGDTLQKSHNIVHIVLHEESLHGAYVDGCFMLIGGLRGQPAPAVKIIVEWVISEYPIEAIVCNSVETFPVLNAASSLRVPTVSLVHEFSEYTRPKGKISDTITAADVVVVPAEIIKTSLCKELKEYWDVNVIPNNIRVHQQGKLPFIPEGNGSKYSIEQLKNKFDICDDTKVIVGAGYVQIRKGVDLFISAAQQIKQEHNGRCKFIWVGNGYNPHADVGYSVWLEKQIEASGLKDDFIFLGHQKDLDEVLSITDSFMLTSRLDPFPNVIIDALNADVHVACFEGSTGCAEFLLANDSNSAVVPYLNTHKMAEEVVSYINLPAKNIAKLKGKNVKLVENKLNFRYYVDTVLDLVEQAKASIVQRVEIETQLLANGLFNPEYYGLTTKPELALDHYVKSGLKGIHRANPCPGFNEAQYIATKVLEQSPYEVGLYHALINSPSCLATHENHIVIGATENALDMKVAIHLHLFYVDLADEFAMYFNCLPRGYDLYVTTCSDNVENDILKSFSNCGVRHIEVIKVDNIGRDVSPFFFTLKGQLTSKNYDIIGHFHSKKSLDSNSSMGNRWRTYLMQNLIGSPNAVNETLSLFKDPKVGVVYAEDSHVVGMASNQSFANDLCKEMKIQNIENAFLYPLGTMFWARYKALLPLFEIEWSKFLQEEPLPYDGSYMHAVERLIPYVSRSQNYKSVTVYSNGTGW